MLRVLVPRFDRIIVTQFQENPRAVATEQLMNLCRDELRQLGRGADAEHLQSRETPSAAWELAQRWAAPEELVCITGSFFIAAEMRGLATAAAVAERPA